MNEVKLSKEPSLKITSFDQPILEFAFCLGSFKNKNFSPGGVGVIIAEGIAITAKHVVESDIRALENTSPSKSIELNYNMQAAQLYDNGKKLAIWNIKKIFFSPVTDIAFLSLEPYNQEAWEYKWKSLGLDLIPPKIGERIFAFGYSNVEIKKPQKNHFEWRAIPMTSVGEVKEIINKTMGLNYPSILTNAPWKNQMSGGPVFNEKGFVCGLIGTSNWEKDNHNYSTAPLIWPSMSTILDINRQGFDQNIEYPALELCKNKIIKGNGWEKIELIKNDGKIAIQLNK